MKFHIEHNVTPNSIRCILPLLSIERISSIDDIFLALQSNNLLISKDYVRRSINMLVDFDLVYEENKKFTLSEIGNKFRRLLDLNPNTFFDLIHYLYFVSWDLHKQEKFGFSWTYQNIVKKIWQNRPLVIEKANIISEILSIAQEEFPFEKKISLSHYAVDGATHWLLALRPPFISKDVGSKKLLTNQGRNNCSSELFLLGVQHLFQKLSIENRSPILLDEKKINSICELCLLDVRNFNMMLDSCRNFYGSYIILSGEWGLSILLEKKISLQELI